MEYYLTIKANFPDEPAKEKVTKLFENLSKRVKKADLEVANDRSTSDLCYQIHHPQALVLVNEFVDEVSALLGNEWVIGKGLDLDAIKELIRGFVKIREQDGDIYLKFILCGYDREIVKLILPLVSNLGAKTASASGVNDEDFNNYEDYEYKDGEIIYKLKER